MIVTIVRIINFIIVLLILLVIIKVFVSYFLSPYHPVRYNIDRIVEPMLRPIRRIIPPIGMLDISPIILIVVIQLLGMVITSIITRIFH